MAKPMKTPGVYIVEKNAFPNSIVEVETAVPAFIGYTAKAGYKGGSLERKPKQITSMGEFTEYFGGAPQPMFSLAAGDVDQSAGDSTSNKPDDNDVNEDSDATQTPKVELRDDQRVRLNGSEYQLLQTAGDYLLYNSMRLFFGNGGEKCFIVSVGSYSDAISKDPLFNGIEPLLKERVPTMVVIPEAVRLVEGDCAAVQAEMLAHCQVMANRFAILDVHDGWRKPGDEVVDKFRGAIGTNGLKYGAAYYPWLETSVVSDGDLGIEHLADKSLIVKDVSSALVIKEEVAAEANLSTPSLELLAELRGVDYTAIQLQTLGEKDREKLAILNDTVRSISSLYGSVIRKMQAQANLLPPSAAMAGIYTRVDNQRGVWNAPANVSISMVNSPSVTLSHGDQEDLNVSTQGKSVNAIREFVGEGVVVWGARTLDGNSLDWRYINIRRTLIMLEESVKLASKAYVFEPNTANTWVTVKSMIGNFLTDIWKRGGLAGASPEDAFSVHVGLGETMTAEDILEGVMKITVLVAPSRPAEFIEITFQQQQQKS